MGGVRIRKPKKPSEKGTKTVRAKIGYFSKKYGQRKFEADVRIQQLPPGDRD